MNARKYQFPVPQSVLVAVLMVLGGCLLLLPGGDASAAQKVEDAVRILSPDGVAFSRTTPSGPQNFGSGRFGCR